MQIGFKLISEAFGPNEIIRQAVRAEQAGFDFVEMSDHFHPWLDNQGHSSFTWTVLGAIAARTERIGLVTGVTCPTIRYHPAIIAQAAATLSLVSDGRFVLGLGSGERLNEHVVGRGFPAIRTRHEMFREACEIIRLLWQGGYHSYDGKHLQLEDARVFDLPTPLPEIIIAAGGPRAAGIAAELGDALFAVDPDAELVAQYRKAGGRGACYAEAPLAWSPDVASAAAAALATNRWGLAGWQVLAELPSPAGFEAASTAVRTEDMTEAFACGPDPDRHMQVIQEFTDAGFDHIVLMNVGPDVEGFFNFFERTLADRVRTLVPAPEPPGR